MRLSNVTIQKREHKRLFILKYLAMHDTQGMTWDDCAALYERDTGDKISGNSLRLRAKRAKNDAKFVHIAEFPEKVVVSLVELTFFGCVWCAIRKFFTKHGLFTKRRPE